MNDRMRGKMELLKERIKKDGIVDGKILKVDSFLNHQVDVLLLAEIAKEFKKRFEGESITKVLTLETSGIPIGCSHVSGTNGGGSKNHWEKY